MNIVQRTLERSSIAVCRYALHNLPRHKPHASFLQGLGEIDTRGPSDYALAVVDGNMDDAEEEDGDAAVGSPVLLKSLGIKRGWENEQPKVRATVSCHFSFDILPIYFVYPG